VAEKEIALASLAENETACALGDFCGGRIARAIIVKEADGKHLALGNVGKSLYASLSVVSGFYVEGVPYCGVAREVEFLHFSFVFVGLTYGFFFLTMQR
jgi:hypothetical protein